MFDPDKELDEKQQIAKAIAGKAHYLTKLNTKDKAQPHKGCAFLYA